MKERESPGLAVLCHADGSVREVLCDHLGVAARIAPGGPASALAGPAQQATLQHYIDELVASQAAYAWACDVEIRGAATELRFAGVVIGETLLLVAARGHEGLARIDAELVRINNEQTNALRLALKELATATQAARGNDDALLGELTRVNNELANLQREMVRKNVELERLNGEKDRLLGMAAHDLRTPLGVILAYADFLREEAGPALTDEQRDFIATIMDSVEFMRTLVDDLLDLSQIESGSLSLDLGDVDLVALVRHNVALNRALAARKDVAVELTAPAAAARVHVDARKIEQVLNNVIGNAVKFSPPGSTVDVRLDFEPGAVRLAIEDHGAGIAPEALANLFQPFAMGRVRGTAGEKGTGLGLAIVRRIVEGHGGEVSVRSAPNEGATFTVVLPRGAAAKSV